MFRVLAVIIGILLSCTACNATAATKPAATSEPAPTSTTRPRDIELHGVDPCTLLTPAERARQGVEGAPYSSASDSVLYLGRVARCSTVGSTPARAAGITITLVTTTGVERFADNTLRVRTVPTRTAGFPALIVHPVGLTDYCAIAVDVSPGQLIEIQYSDVRQAPPISQNDLCQGGLDVATSAMSWLLAR